jgi:hypothetical protein
LVEKHVSFDPFAIHDYHDKVREKIEAGECGFAQSVVHEVMVSYESASFRGPVYGYDPVAFGTTPRLSAIQDQIIVDVAPRPRHSAGARNCCSTFISTTALPAVRCSSNPSGQVPLAGRGLLRRHCAGMTAIKQPPPQNGLRDCFLRHCRA